MNEAMFSQSPVRKSAARGTSLVLILLLSGILVFTGSVHQVLADEGTPADAVASEGDAPGESVPPEQTPTPAQTQPPAPEQQPPATLESGEVPDASLAGKQPQTSPSTDDAESTVPEKTPALTYQTPDSPDCRLAPESETAVRSGGFVEYICSDAVRLHAEYLAGASVSVSRTVRAFADGSWTMQLASAPATLPIADLVWTPPAAVDVSIDVPAQYVPGSEIDDSDIDLMFRVRLHRPTCSLAAPELRFQRETTVETAGVAAQLEGAVPTDSARLNPELAPIPEPSVSFNGPIDFGVIEVDAMGMTEQSLNATLSMTVSHIDRTCGSWKVYLSAPELVGASGDEMPGSRLQVFSVNGIAIEPCELGNSCAVYTVDAAHADSSGLVLVIGLKLQLPGSPAIGEFHTSLKATLLREEGR